MYVESSCRCLIKYFFNGNAVVAIVVLALTVVLTAEEIQEKEQRKACKVALCSAFHVKKPEQGEVDRAKAQLKAGLMMSLESSSARAEQMA